MEILVTVLAAVVSGTIVYAVKELLDVYVLEPAKRYKAIVGRIDNGLKLYANIFTNPDMFTGTEVVKECSSVLRLLSCELGVAQRQRILFKRSDVDISDAARELIGISNSLGARDGSINAGRCDKIRKLLNILSL